ncbi:hypothetical protein B0H13DRAFT_516961 [Mycena leptocephala]|nr:hypothetical protein B0H13DRAFT_516961 [Mycena leptocephala]
MGARKRRRCAHAEHRNPVTTGRNRRLRPYQLRTDARLRCALDLPRMANDHALACAACPGLRCPHFCARFRYHGCRPHRGRASDGGAGARRPDSAALCALAPQGTRPRAGARARPAGHARGGAGAGAGGRTNRGGGAGARGLWLVRRTRGGVGARRPGSCACAPRCSRAEGCHRVDVGGEGKAWVYEMHALVAFADAQAAGRARTVLPVQVPAYMNAGVHFVSTPWREALGGCSLGSPRDAGRRARGVGEEAGA